MKNTNYITRIFLLLFISTLFACKGENQKQEVKEEVLSELVEVQAIEEQRISRTIEFPASLTAFEENYLASATPGRIEKIFVEVGSIVKKGQILVQMDRTQLIQAEVQLANLRVDYQRFDTLIKAGSIAQQKYDQLKAQYDVAVTNVEFLKENTQLKAPFSGVVSGKYFEDGEMYSGAPNTAVGKAAIVSLVQIDQLKAFVSLPEQYFPEVKQGKEVNVKLEIYPNKKFSGKVYRIHPTIDPNTHTFQTEVLISNKENLLRPGMFSRISFDMEQVTALMVPANAVLKLQGSNERYVFIAENGKAKRVTVKLGDRYDDKVEISGDIQKGQELIVIGQARLLDNVDIRIKK